MKTLRQVIKELQEFGEENNAMDLPCLCLIDTNNISTNFRKDVRDVNTHLFDYNKKISFHIINQVCGLKIASENKLKDGPIVVL